MGNAAFLAHPNTSQLHRVLAEALSLLFAPGIRCSHLSPGLQGIMKDRGQHISHTCLRPRDLSIYLSFYLSSSPPSAFYPFCCHLPS